MRKDYIAIIFLFFGLATFSQGAVFLINFEGVNPLSSLPGGVISVNGTNSVNVQGSGLIAETPNAVLSDGNGGKELFMDYQGHLKMPITTPAGFSFVSDYKRTGNGDWWLGVITLTGVESGNNKIQRLLIRSTGGDLSGLNIGGLDNNFVIPQNSEKHIALSVNNGVCTFYVNGAQVGTTGTSIGVENWTNVKLYFSYKIKNDYETTGIAAPEESYLTACRDTRAYVDNISYFERAISAQNALDLYNGANPLTLSVKNNKVENFKAYPIPLQNVLNFTSNKITSVEVYNLLGSKVLSKNVFNKSVEVSALSQGIFTIICKNQNGENISVIKAVK